MFKQIFSADFSRNPLKNIFKKLFGKSIFIFEYFGNIKKSKIMKAYKTLAQIKEEIYQIEETERIQGLKRFRNVCYLFLSVGSAFYLYLFVKLFFHL